MADSQCNAVSSSSTTRKMREQDRPFVYWYQGRPQATKPKCDLKMLGCRSKTVEWAKLNKKHAKPEDGAVTSSTDPFLMVYKEPDTSSTSSSSSDSSSRYVQKIQIVIAHSV